MPKPNYSFEKRQRELEKKRKKAEKEAEKAARKNAPPGTGEDAGDGDAAEPDSDAQGGEPASSQ